jgi:hypothetical protein
VKDEKGDLLAEFHNILNRWNNCFSQLLNALRVSDVRQIEIHTAELIVTILSSSDVEIATAKLAKYKLSGIDQIPAELIQQEVKYYSLRSMNSLILFYVRKNFLRGARSLLLD